MKLLIYDWGAWFRDDLYAVLKTMNISYTLFTWNFNAKGHNKNDDRDFVDHFCSKYDTSCFDAVFSVNYWPMISEACNIKGIKYISWSYDSPIDIERPEDTFGNECNYIFLYDRYESEKYKNAGFNNVFHMPLGVNTSRLAKFDYFKKECDRYRADVSFVGGLYDNFFGGILGCLDDNTKLVLQKIVEVQTNLQNSQYVLDQVLTDGLVSMIDSQIRAFKPAFKQVTKEQLEFTISQEITRRERIVLLNLCGKRYKTNLYSGSKFDILESVIQRSTVDYVSQMPIVFAATKINLNPASFAIRSGVSLRAFDVMACGGFLLSNYKEENQDYFDIGKEMEQYVSMEDAIEKIDYYLSHEDIRLEVAKSGRARVKRDHRMEDRLSDIFEIVGI